MKHTLSKLGDFSSIFDNKFWLKVFTGGISRKSHTLHVSGIFKPGPPYVLDCLTAHTCIDLPRKLGAKFFSIELN